VEIRALMCEAMQMILEGSAMAPGHMEALLQELFIEEQVSAADYSPGDSAQLTAALQNGRGSFPMSSLLPPHSSEPLPDAPLHETSSSSITFRSSPW
jgi:hypothetical protein